MGKKKIDEIKFDEYKTFIEDTARFTERRQNASNLYVTVNSLLLTAMVFAVKDTNANDVWVLWLSLPVVIAGVFVSFWWHQLIFKYKELVRLRIRALRKMENSDQLTGIEKMYHLEDELYPINVDGSIRKGEGLNFSDLEAKLPILFGVLYAFAGIIIICTLISRLT